MLKLDYLSGISLWCRKVTWGGIGAAIDGGKGPLFPVYLQPAQEDDEHPPHPELPPDPSEDLPMPNFESFFSASFDPQEGQTTSGFEPKTSFSKQHWHFLQ